MERNQSSEERHFGVMKRRQSFRPHLNQSSLLQEEQLKQFGRYPDLFEKLGYENNDANLLLKEHLERFEHEIEEESKGDNDHENDQENDDQEDDDHDIIKEINILLKERDFLDEEDEEDFSDDDTEW